MADRIDLSELRAWTHDQLSVASIPRARSVLALVDAVEAAHVT